MSTILKDQGGRVLNKSDTRERLPGETGRTAVANSLIYREVCPPSALANVVECFWRRDCWRPPTPALGVLPDGRMDLIWASNGRVVVIGPQSRPHSRPLPPQVIVIGVRFPPGVGPALLGVPAEELANRHVPLDAIDARPARSLLRHLVTIEDVAAAPVALARAVATRIDSSWTPDPVVRQAAVLCEHPRARVERVAAALGISERQLQRRCRETVGYGPKTLQRVLRLQRLLTALTLGKEQLGGLARIAPALGYSDQAHMTRETREFSGLTPAQLAHAVDVLKQDGASGIFKTGRQRPGAEPGNGLSHAPRIAGDAGV